MVSRKIGSAGGHEILLRIDRDAVCSGNVCEGFQRSYGDKKREQVVNTPEVAESLVPTLLLIRCASRI